MDAAGYNASGLRFIVRQHPTAPHELSGSDGAATKEMCRQASNKQYRLKTERFADTRRELMKDLPRIVHQCQEGHPDAFATLFNHFQNRVYDLASAIMLDEVVAEDVVQDTFLAVFRKIEGFRAESRFETWLTSIVVNQCRMRQRKQRLRGFLQLDQLSPRRLLRLSREQDDVGDIVRRRQQSLALWRMVDQLPDRLRLPLILRYRYALPCDEIGEILERRTSTIYQYLNEGRRELERMAQAQEVVSQVSLAETTGWGR